MRTILIWLAAAFVFGSFYLMVAQKESQLRDGRTVYLKLVPVDPRSLMQGDYMALNYEVSRAANVEPWRDAPSTIFYTGTMIIRLDEHSVATFSRMDDGRPLAPEEQRLRFHHRGDWQGAIGAESYFIPEGTGDRFARAVYGELKLSPDGVPLLIGLCDKDRKQLVAVPTAQEK